MTDVPTETSSRIGVILTPTGFDASYELLGLSLLLRHALALQSAGCERLVLLGAAPALAPDERLRIPYGTELGAHTHALVVRSDVTTHRSVPPRLAKIALAPSGETIRAGDDVAGFYACTGDRTASLVAALGASSGATFDRSIPLLDGVSAEFVVPIRDPRERLQAKWKHLVSLRKATSGYFERLYMRPLSLFMTWPLASTRVTPNAMSLVTFAFGLASAAMMAVPGEGWAIAGALTHLFMRVVDCIDGELARLRYQGSALGAWLDSICDGISMAAFVAAIGYRLDQAGSPYGVVGYVGAAAWMLVQLLEWRGAYLADTGGSVQTIEWGHRAENPSFVERFVARIELLLRMDAISTYYGVAILLGAFVPLVVVHTILATSAAAYYLTQLRKLPAG